MKDEGSKENRYPASVQERFITDYTQRENKSTTLLSFWCKGLKEVMAIDVLSGYASGRNIKIIHNFISNSVREGRKQSEEGFVLLIPQENKNLHSFVVIIALNFLSSAGIRPRQKRGFLATFPGWG